MIDFLGGGGLFIKVWNQEWECRVDWAEGHSGQKG